MKLSLITFCLASVLQRTTPAPAVSSVHVSFISGNKATQYSHGIRGGGREPLVQYSLVSSPRVLDGTLSPNTHKRRRSITNDLGSTESLKTVQFRRQRQSSTTNEPSSSQTPTPTAKVKSFQKKPFKIPLRMKFRTTNVDTTTESSDPDPTTTTEPQAQTAASMLKRLRSRESRVKFVSPEPTPTSSSASTTDKDDETVTETMTQGSLLEELKLSHVDSLLKRKGKKVKDSKAVKRSPFIADNFDAGGITFPDFDEFGGDEFGSLRNFGGGGGSLGAHTHANPESLSPDGVFLPPLPTEASDYENNDPYLSDPDTAKYASQHPPFFAAFPHKRAVLGLNEQRVHNGLEPNILRSIRPYFAFFEAANDHSLGHNSIYEASDSDLDYHDYPLSHVPHPHRPPPLPLPSRPSPVTYSSTSGSDLFHNLDPNQLLYAESHDLQPYPFMKSWSIFDNKK